jgi:AAA domain-containing protein
LLDIAGIKIHNTADLFNEATKICALVYSPPGVGKTTFAATLDKLTKRIYGKPTLFIAIEAGEGGGTASIQSAGVDYVVPEDRNQLDKLLATLQSDTHYAGVVFDSATEGVKRYIQPFALSMENVKEKSPLRTLGVPGRSDYQTMGEMMRSVSQKLINLTTKNKNDGTPDLNIRKHLIMTALQRVKTEGEEVVGIGPDLPGAMMTTSTAMFQQVFALKIKQIVERDANDPKKAVRKTQRVVVTESDGLMILKDRFNVFPKEFEPDLDAAWEKYWVPKLAIAR